MTNNRPAGPVRAGHLVRCFVPEYADPEPTEPTAIEVAPLFL
jgi:hypothetical protein